MYEGKWVDDAPVCGEYRAPLSDEVALFGPLDPPEKWPEEGSEKVLSRGLQKLSLPILELYNPDEVLTPKQMGKE